MDLLSTLVPIAISERHLTATPLEFVYNLHLQFDGLCGTRFPLRLYVNCDQMGKVLIRTLSVGRGRKDYLAVDRMPGT